jgi:sugar (pentulose or hexulose) kinase
MQDVFLIYDIGKTNKKCLVFSTDGRVLDEYMEQFVETEDEDGFPCEDLQKLEVWVLGQFELLQKNERYKIVGINFATYGASFVHIDANGKPLTALYNYLKPYPKEIEEQFFNTYFNSDAKAFALATASPYMGMLNSGLQLYWLKHTQPAVWDKVQYSLHLPQYLSYLFTEKAVSDFTSIGCHTGLWSFENYNYEHWVVAEGIDKKLPIINRQPNLDANNILIGTGLHDSSSALIPYLLQYKDPFLLISTGTWCVNLNPFNQQQLTTEALNKDCLHFLQANGKLVKASRIFLGKEHEYQAERIAKHFKIETDFYKSIGIAENVDIVNEFIPYCMEGTGPIPKKQLKDWDITVYTNAAQAYTALMHGLINLLKISIDLIDTKDVQQFYIDGGFASNKLFTYFLKQLYPTKEIKAVEFPQATALGAYFHLKELMQ